MSLALRINVDSTIEEIEVNNIVHTLQTETFYPFDEYKLIERYEINNCYMYLYGMLNLSYPINQYEFQQFNMTGDVFVVLVDREGDFLDLNEIDFLGFYELQIDLDDTLIEDELNNTDDEKYDSSFVEEDRYNIDDEKYDSDSDVVMT